VIESSQGIAGHSKTEGEVYSKEGSLQIIYASCRVFGFPEQGKGEVALDFTRVYGVELMIHTTCSSPVNLLEAMGELSRLGPARLHKLV
jgi:hypothetical protein